MEHKITLLTGYTDQKGVVHRDVTFGRRVTVGDMMLLDADPRRQNPTQYNDLILRRMITSFGELSIPVGENVLLSLDSVDREDLMRAADTYIVQSRSRQEYEFAADNTVTLREGITVNGDAYTVVQFGKLTTGRDEVDADGQSLTGVSRECFLLGRQITKLTSDDAAASIDGPVELKNFNTLDSEDLQLLRTAAQMARITFRLKRAIAEEERDGEAGPGAAAGDGNVGGGDPQPADGTDPDVRAGADGDGGGK